MPAVFVHGVPETGALWDTLRACLHRKDTLALDLPGFGAARPEGFSGTKEAYVAWLVQQLETMGGPIDLVGHDWGGGFVIRVASLRSDLLRSWASDALYVTNEDYEWHQFAKVWQTPGQGEAWVRQQLETPLEQRSQLMQRFGIPPTDADRLVAWFDETMGQAILDLYRSAIDVGGEWAGDLEGVRAPGLALFAPADPFSEASLVRKAARRAHARIATLDELGHWWMLQDPPAGARALEEFWASI